MDIFLRATETGFDKWGIVRCYCSPDSFGWEGGAPFVNPGRNFVEKYISI
jgi:hypothetical protein